MRLFSLVAAALAIMLSSLTYSSGASAQNVIKQPNNHPKYRAELEPHGVFRAWHRRFGRYADAPGRRRNGFGDVEFGAGFRASIELGDPAFIPSINNTVGITFGADITNCNGYCPDPELLFYFPVGMQWNFFFTKHWSVMFEPGLVVIGYSLFDDAAVDFMVAGGARYHFNDDIALTMKVGYPFTFSIGPSFFVGN